MKEVRAVDILCRERNKNIVTVLCHGWLSSSCYYFDMELCDLNLETYISGKYQDAFESDGSYDTRISVILYQIASGVHFIHKHQQVHRDLKPRNGKAATKREL